MFSACAVAVLWHLYKQELMTQCVVVQVRVLKQERVAFEAQVEDLRSRELQALSRAEAAEAQVCKRQCILWQFANQDVHVLLSILSLMLPQ